MAARRLQKKRWVLASSAALLLALVGGGWAVLADSGKAGKDEPLALFTSLPIYWSEARDISAMLNDRRAPHWARTALEQSYRLVPLDTLDDKDGGLADVDRLAMIQPRPLSPPENVALDTWVARGGRLLLFADPALTEESAFALGDRRRPQDIVLLSPILARWGLALEFDEDQAFGRREVTLGSGAALPVNLPGRFVATPGGREAACRIDRGGLVARCRIGRGRVTAVADAALFEDAGDPAARADALDRLVVNAF